MDVLYSPETRQADTFPLVTEATAFLREEVLGPKDAPAVSAEWTRHTDRSGQTFDRLTLRDEHGEAHTDFTAFELTSAPRSVRVGLYHLWGDLQAIYLRQLREENSRLLRELVAAGTESE